MSELGQGPALVVPPATIVMHAREEEREIGYYVL